MVIKWSYRSPIKEIKCFSYQIEENEPIYIKQLSKKKYKNIKNIS